MKTNKNTSKFGSYVGDWLFFAYCLGLIVILSITYGYVRSEILVRSALYYLQ